MTINWYFEIDWDGDGNFTERNEASRVIDFYCRRGRQDYIDDVGGGFMDWDVSYAEIILDNEDLLYDPRNTGSSLYPNVVPGKLARVRVQEDSGTIYGVIAGEVVDIRPVSHNPRETKVVIRGLEDKLRTASSVSLQEDKTADYLMDLVLTDISYPSEFGWDLDTGEDVIPYWWIDDKSAKVALFELACSTLGRYWIDRDGQVRFRTRYDLTDTLVETYTQDIILREPEIPMPWDWSRNYVTLGVYPRTVGSLTDVWTLGEVPYLEAGQSLSFWGEFRYDGEAVPVKDEVTPVQTTDFTLNELEGGGGSDYSSDMSIEEFSVYGTSFYIEIKNNGSSGGYVTLLKVRAKPVYVVDKMLTKSDKSGSDVVRKFSQDLTWLQSLITGITFSDFMANALSAVVPTPRIKLEDRFDEQFGVDLVDYVRMDLDDLNVDEYLTIGYIEHSWLEPKNGQAVGTIIHTEPVFDLSLYWVFPSEFTMYFSL